MVALWLNNIRPGVLYIGFVCCFFELFLVCCDILSDQQISCCCWLCDITFYELPILQNYTIFVSKFQYLFCFCAILIEVYFHDTYSWSHHILNCSYNARESARNATLVIQMNGKTTSIKDPENPSTAPKDFTFDFSYWSHDSFTERADGYNEPSSSKYADQVSCFNIKMVFILFSFMLTHFLFCFF